MTEQTRAVVQRQPFDAKAAYTSIEAAIRDREQQIVSTLAPTISPERFIAVALQAITRSPRLLECTTSSIIKALRDAAELGLGPSGLMGSAYLVPYKNRKTQRYEAQLIPGYRGLIGLARRSGEVRTIESHVVRQRDDFDYAYGSEQFIRHRPWLNTSAERGPDVIDERGETQRGQLLDAGPYVAAYALARLNTGEVQFEVMDVAAIEAVRRRSKAADDGPWVTDYAEMMRKTPTRRLFKYLPLSVVALQRALELEDEAETNAVAVSVSTPARRALAASLGVQQDAQGDAIDDETDESTADEQGDDPEQSDEHTDEAETGEAEA